MENLRNTPFFYCFGLFRGFFDVNGPSSVSEELEGLKMLRVAKKSENQPTSCAFQSQPLRNWQWLLKVSFFKEFIKVMDIKE